MTATPRSCWTTTRTNTRHTQPTAAGAGAPEPCPHPTCSKSPPHLQRGLITDTPRTPSCLERAPASPTAAHAVGGGAAGSSAEALPTGGTGPLPWAPGVQGKLTRVRFCRSPEPGAPTSCRTARQLWETPTSDEGSGGAHGCAVSSTWTLQCELGGRARAVGAHAEGASSASLGRLHPALPRHGPVPSADGVREMALQGRQGTAPGTAESAGTRPDLCAPGTGHSLAGLGPQPVSP